MRSSNNLKQKKTPSPRRLLRSKKFSPTKIVLPNRSNSKRKRTISKEKEEHNETFHKEPVFKKTKICENKEKPTEATKSPKVPITVTNNSAEKAKIEKRNKNNTSASTNKTTTSDGHTKKTKNEIREKLTSKNIVGRKKHAKQNLRHTSSRQIPRDVLERSLDMLNNPNHVIWQEKNTSCVPSIHHYYENYRAIKIKTIGHKLKYARECLLRRDWENLARVVTICIAEEKEANYYSAFAKYAAICLAYNDLERFKQFMQTHNVTDENEAIKKCTTIKRKIEE